MKRSSWPLVAFASTALVAGGAVGLYQMTGSSIKAPASTSMTNPAVTQDTIDVTICKPGWTATVRPPVADTNSYKHKLVKALPATASHRLADYELDHVIPLELGGATFDTFNLRLELRVSAGGQAEVKDKEENSLRAAVCTGHRTLDEARAKILADWPPTKFP